MPCPRGRQGQGLWAACTCQAAWALVEPAPLLKTVVAHAVSKCLLLLLGLLQLVLKPLPCRAVHPMLLAAPPPC
eukprot:scaffold248323_cov18-Tisochrysis_lutea.AAC.1